MGAAAIPDLGLCRRRKAVSNARDSAGVGGLEFCVDRLMESRDGVADRAYEGRVADGKGRRYPAANISLAFLSSGSSFSISFNRIARTS